MSITTRRLLPLLAAVALLSGPPTAPTALLPEDAAAASCPAPPAPQTMDNPTYYSFVQTYDSACASSRNWDRTFGDVGVSTLVDGRNRLSVTTSTALGGAIASLRVNGVEFIASGGHGSAAQWAFHAWRDGAQATECYNPTQAGSRLDDQGPPPFHGPSTSALYTLSTTGVSGVVTASRPAMYVPLSMSEPGFGGCRAADYQPERSPYTFGLSPYWLRTTVAVAPDSGLSGLDNVIRATADLTSEDDLYANFVGELVVYLQRDFVRAYSYDPTTRTLTERQTDDPGTLHPIVRCTSEHAYCLGMYFGPSALPGAYYYSATRPPAPYNGMSGEYLTQVAVPAHGIGGTGTTSRHYEVELAVGDLPRTTATLDELSRRLR